MNIFSDKVYRKQFTTLIFVLLIFIIAGQLMVCYISYEYKQSLLYHDYGIAGYLYEKNLQDIPIAKVFTSTKTDENIIQGQGILESAGYNEETQNRLIFEIDLLYKKSAITLFVLSLVLSISILLSTIFFNAKRIQQIEKANKEIKQFIDGKIDIRLKDYDEGSLSKLFSTINDLATSLSVHIEKEKHNKEFLKDTISDISHQLKTPLAALQMYNEIMQEETGNIEVIEKFIPKSTRELKRIEVLIQNLLKLAKLDSNNIVLEKKHHLIKPFIEDCISVFHTRADNEGKTFVVNCNNDIYMNFDKEWLQEAIVNIIKNALDHISEGGLIEITCHNTHVLTLLTIKDNGKGIHPEDIHHIFKRFYRSRFSKDKQGVGIGLALAKAIVEKHEGTISVESTLNEGTTFHLAFPNLTKL